MGMNDNPTLHGGSWAEEFRNPKQYVERKLKMLRSHMKIPVTEEEVVHLKTLKTRGDIDRAVASIIDRHWG